MSRGDQQGGEADELVQRHDDFTRIVGVGPVIERQLHEAGVVTYAQLGALSPDQIAGLVGNLPLLSVERIAKQDWPGQARRLAADSTSQNDGSQESPQLHQHYATFHIELLLTSLGAVRRTRVVHVQSGEEQSWAGWDEELLRASFRQQAALPAPAGAGPHPELPPATAAPTHDTAGQPHAPLAPAEPAHSDQPPAPDERGPLQLAIAEIALDELPADAGRPGPPPAKHVRATIQLRLAGAGARRIAADQLWCAFQLLACNLESGSTAVLAAGRLRLATGQLAYAPAVEFPLPEPGRYQLVGIALLLDEALLAYALGDVLRVLA
jgi:hypothetical protein